MAASTVMDASYDRKRYVRQPACVSYQTFVEEAVAVAVEACADDTKGQTCYICTQALHWKTKEGLVRGCSCRGTAGFAHVSCLAEQAKILVAEAEEHNFDDDRFMPRWKQWYECRLCEQRYHGVVRCALGWACWKTYLGRPEADWVRGGALTQLGNGLGEAGRLEERLGVVEVELANETRFGAPENEILNTKTRLANCYISLGRAEEALSLHREIYSRSAALDPTDVGREVFGRLQYAVNLASSLLETKRHAEAKSLLRKQLSQARRATGAEHATFIRLRGLYAKALYLDDCASRNDVAEAVTILEDLYSTARRVFGSNHPLLRAIKFDLERAIQYDLHLARRAIIAAKAA